MKLFFGVNNKLFYSNLSIPKFSFKNIFFKNALLCKINIFQNKWRLNILSEIRNDENFFYLDEKEITNNDIFFSATKEQLKFFDDTKIVNLQSFTSQKDYRSSFTIFLRKSNGFSSYQSDYPFKMTFAKGSIVTPTSMLTNKNCKNYLILKNILNKPIEDDFRAHIINYKTKEVVDTFFLKTNYSNFIELKEKHIKIDNYLVTEKYLCIPIYISENKGHLSMEHTNPISSSLFSQDRIDKTIKFKKKINEIINKKNFN